MVPVETTRLGLFFFLDEVHKLSSSIYCGFKGHTVHIGGGWVGSKVSVS